MCLLHFKQSSATFTLQDWHRSPHVDCPLAAELTDGRLECKKRNSTKNQHHEIGDEKGTCSQEESRKFTASFFIH